MKDTKATGETVKVGQVYAPIPAEADRDDDWLWMVAADPAFYLEEYDGVRFRGRG